MYTQYDQRKGFELENFAAVGIFLIAIAYWTSVFLIRNRNGQNERLSTGLFRLGVLSGIWAICSGILWLGGLSESEEKFYILFNLSGMLFFSILILDYSLPFLKINTSNRNWISLGISIWVFMLPFGIVVFTGSELLKFGDWLIPRYVPALVVASIGVIALAARTIQLTAIAFSSASQPSHKNRLLYWTLAQGIFILSYLFVLLNQGIFGGILNLIGFWVLVYIVLNNNPVDLIRMGAQSLRFSVTALLTVGVYTAGFLIAEVILSGMRVAHPGLTALLLAAVFVLVFNPGVNWVAHRINNLVFGQSYNPSVIVREYSQTIGNVVDLRLLKQLSLGLIYKVIGIKNGNLYLVDEIKENGETFYRLSPIRSGDSSDEAVIEGRLAASSPVALHFNQLKRPLLQYELDFSSVFKDLLHTDREWLLLQNAEAFIPILTKSGWIGLFVLGAKQSGEKYGEDDLFLLSTLADQTAVALENARLFANLSRVNRELQLAQVDLEMANQQLREMDDLKTSFIRVVTHELRTPLANMAFSLQILRMYSSQQYSQEQLEQLEQVEANLVLTRMMVDNLITLATFLNRQAELKLELLDFKTLASETIASIKKIADEKGVDLQVFFVGDLLSVKADRKLLSDAVFHLVQNAVKFTPPKGKVWVTCWAATDLLYFDVKDTGIGVPRDKLETLWYGFTQASDPELRGQEGLGLGLALVRFIVTAHGGKLWVESTQGEGSTFGFRIPLAGPGAAIE